MITQSLDIKSLNHHLICTKQFCLNGNNIHELLKSLDDHTTQEMHAIELKFTNELTQCNTAIRINLQVIS